MGEEEVVGNHPMVVEVEEVVEEPLLYYHRESEVEALRVWCSGKVEGVLWVPHVNLKQTVVAVVHSEKAYEQAGFPSVEIQEEWAVRVGMGLVDPVVEGRHLLAVPVCDSHGVTFDHRLDV